MRVGKRKGKDRENGSGRGHPKTPALKEESGEVNEELEEEIEAVKNLEEDEFNVRFGKMLVSASLFSFINIICIVLSAGGVVVKLFWCISRLK